MGFVVTSNDVKTLLRSKGLPFQEGTGGPAFEGPELAPPSDTGCGVA